MKFASFCKKYIRDLLSIGITLILVLATLIGMFFLFPSTESGTVEVYYRNRLIDRFDIKVDRTITFCKTSESASNCDYTGFSDFQGEILVLEIKDKSIQVVEETSKKKLCSIQGKVTSSNLPVICLPNSFMAVITSQDDGEFDV